MRLDLNDIKYILSETKRMIINEISVQDAYQRFYSDIPQEDYQKIIAATKNSPEVLSPEAKWVLNLYKRKSPRLMENLYKLHNELGEGYLDIFNRLKDTRRITGPESDLNRYKSISELGAFTNQFDIEDVWMDANERKKTQMRPEFIQAKDDIDKLYEDDTWLVISPKSYEASCYWGDGTEWCTAYKDDDHYYQQHTSEGPLYININKQTGEKYQFHFESEQFMDKDDRGIKSPVLTTIGANQGVVNTYKKILENDDEGLLKLYKLIFTEWDNEEDYIVFRTPENKFIIFDTYFNEQIYYEPLDDYSFEDGCIRIKCNGSWTLYNTSGTFGGYSEYWYDYISEIKDEIGIAEYRGLYNIINLQGEIISDEWFTSIKRFDCSWSDFEDIYIVTNEEKQYNVLDTFGDLTLPYWVDDIESSPSENTSKIQKDGKYNLINKNGSIMFPEWFDDILNDENISSQDGVFYPVCKDGKWNFFSEETHYGSKYWFDEIVHIYKSEYTYDSDMVAVIYDGKEYWFDIDYGTLDSKDKN